MSTATTDDAANDGTDSSTDDNTSEPTAEEKLEKLENDVAAAKKVNKDLERKYKTSQTELEKLTAAAKANPDGAPDSEAIKAEARKEALAEAKAASDERVIRSEVKAAAGIKLADPNDAVRLLDLSDFEVDDDGNVDEKAIADAIDRLIKSKPYLAAQGGKRFQGSGDGGARNGSSASTPADDFARFMHEQLS